MEVSTTQAAAFLGKSERTVQRYIKLGKLPARQLPNGQYVVNVADLEPLRGDQADIEMLSQRVEALEQTVQALRAELDEVRQDRTRQAPSARVLKPGPAHYTVSHDDLVTARSFAERHQVGRERMETWIKKEAFSTTITDYHGKTQHQLNADQQRGVIAYWRENHIPFEPCTVEGCPCHEQK